MVPDKRKQLAFKKHKHFLRNNSQESLEECSPKDKQVTASHLRLSQFQLSCESLAL